MFIQYKLSDGDIVNIQATNNCRGCDVALSAQGRGQYEVADNINPFSRVNVTTGEILAPLVKSQDTPILTDSDYVYKSTLTMAKI